MIETERLTMRPMTQADYPALCKMLQDDEVMKAYEGAYSDSEAQEWLDRQLARYEKWGFGLWAAVLKETGEMIGQCGLSWKEWNGQPVLEVGYLFQKEYWHQGFAIEAASACKEYAFDVLGAQEVCSIIRDTNTASQKVAVRNGMVLRGTFIEHFRGVDMPHCVYCVRRPGAGGDEGDPCPR